MLFWNASVDLIPWNRDIFIDFLLFRVFVILVCIVIYNLFSGSLAASPQELVTKFCHFSS